jgi:hypothetical protein
MPRAPNFAVRTPKKNIGKATSKNKEGDKGEKLMVKKSQRGRKKMY